MTEKGFFNRTKLKAICILLCVFALSFCMFTLYACGEETTTDDTTYTKAESDSSDIINGSFEYGTADIALSDLPQSASLTGWSSATTEKSSGSSAVSSGIIKTDDDAWKAVISKLYDNSTFYSKIKTVYGIDVDSIKETVKTENPDKSDTEINELAKEKVLESFVDKNPKTHDGAEGNGIYMLNGYTSDEWYTAQVTTSSSTLSLAKGSYAKITFYVYTQYVNGGDYKVNVRLTNTFNTASQAQYILSGVGSSSWQQYSVYLKADDEFSSTFNVVLSIGYSSAAKNAANYAEGTAFFDDVVYTELTETEYASQTAGISASCIKTLDYNSDAKNLTQQAGSDLSFIYDLSLDSSSYFTDFTSAVASAASDPYFTGISETSYTKFGSESETGTKDYFSGIKITGIKYASVSVKIDGGFSVDPEEYLLINFDITFGLTLSGSTDLTVLVYDEDDNENNVVTYSYSETENPVKASVLILNNSPTDTRNFYMVLVIGPTDVKNTSSKYDFASGDIEISNVKCAEGKSYQYVKDTDGNAVYPKEETADYKYYNLYSSLAESVRIDSYVAPTTDTYYLSSAKSYGGSITSAPVAVEGYKGVGYDSIYVKPDGENSEINQRTGKDGDGNGNYAGLVNSNVDYSSSVTAIDINSALNYSGEKSIQPIMIYNAAADSYGFVGKSFTVSASSYAAISVKVRVTGDAKANVYLVNASDTAKSVYSMSFKGNVKGNYYGETFTGKLAFTNIVATDMEADGWLKVTFYIATGANSMDLRLEIWNGDRDGQDKSQGFVFFAFDAFGEDETFAPSTLSSAFTEPTSTAAAFTESGNPLYDNAVTAGDVSLRDSVIKYNRELDPTEIKYNKENPDNAVSYDPTYVWAESRATVYSVFNTIDPVAVDPYASDNEDEGSGCTAETDPSTFWLSFSSILLGVALVVAILMLVIKNVRRRRKANKNDATSHYNVSSRYKNDKAKKSAKKEKAKKEFKGYEDEEDYEEQPAETAEPETAKEETPEPEKHEENLDEYVYGDVQDFGESEDGENKE